MAYHVIHEMIQTVRQSPIRAALASVLLLTTTMYVCLGHDGYRVAEIGDATRLDELNDLTSDADLAAEIEQDSTGVDETPATSTRIAGREQYIDARLVQAFAEENDSSPDNQTQVTLVSGQSERRTSSDAPVWLLGVLSDD